MTSVESPSGSVSLTFSCQHLPRADITSKSDPFVQICSQGISGTWNSLGKTETIQNNHNPVEVSFVDGSVYFRNEKAPVSGTWNSLGKTETIQNNHNPVEKAPVSRTWNSLDKTETVQNNHNPAFAKDIIVPYHFEEEQIFSLRVYDDDYGRKADDFLGEVKFKLGTLMGCKGQKMRLQLTNRQGREKKATVIIRGEKIDGSTGTANIQLSARNLDRKDGIFGMGKSDPFYIIAKLIPGSNPEEYETIYKSEWIKQNLNPRWKVAKIPLHRLENAKLRLEVSDWDSDSKTDLIGYANITFAELISYRKGIALIHPPTKSKYTKLSYVNSGMVDVDSCEIEKSFTFVEYLRGGLQMNLMVGIDFTGSNGDPRTPVSLHYGAGTRPNDYMYAIQSVASVLLEYDSDKMVPSFGFGAKPNPASMVSHCFALNGNEFHPDVHGIDGVVEAYKSVFNRGCILSGPTYFSELIHRASAMASSSAGSTYSYSMLLLITDGAVNDLQATIDALVEASSSPLSVVIVGVGKADFSAMVALDGDVNPLISSRGKRCARDIVQFVEFNKFRTVPQALAKETLAEIPDQVIDFFRMNSKAPGKPIVVSDESCLNFMDEDIAYDPNEVAEARAPTSFYPPMPSAPPIAQVVMPPSAAGVVAPGAGAALLRNAYGTPIPMAQTVPQSQSQSQPHYTSTSF